MRTLFGLLVLGVGLVLLGLWGRSDHAPDMEAMVAQNAQAALGETTHETQLYVSGRDITISGLADSEAERDQIIAALNGVEGRRVVIDNLPILASASPYVFSGAKDGDTLSYSGNVPSDSGRAAFTPAIGDAAEGLNLASGMPDAQWPSFVTQGVKSLGLLESGQLDISDRTLRLTGDAADPSVQSDVDALLAQLPEGYSSEVSLNLLDDGTPASLDLNYTEGLTTIVSGKAPAGVDGNMISNMLGGATTYLKASAQDGASQFGNVFDAIGQVLPKFMSASANVTRDAVTFKGKLKEGEAKAPVMDMLSAAFGNSSIEIEETTPEPVVVDEAPSEAESADTGTSENSANIDLAFTPSAEACKETTNSVLAGAKVNFVTGSTELDEDSQSVMNVLAQVLGRCVNDTDLAVEIGGHTDSQGDAFKNLVLSKKRADAVRKALFDRGVNASAMVARGYGETQPIADNATAEGRAQNRRTTFVWTDN